MLPLYLSIEGFYSYEEKQEIDFTALTEGGLFGIFGAVGSGKSSIIEAISLVLYGDTERLNKSDKRGYNMLNLRSKQAHIVFDFLNFEGKKHRFTAQWKRKNTKFEETSSIERFAYAYKNGDWIPLPSVDGHLVTNLSYPNFRRTIIIPQGQFKEFLELKGKERSDMMKEIFQLDRFDLGPRVAVLQAANNRKLEHLKGALSGFETISIDVLKEKEAIFASEKKQLQILKDHYDKTQTDLQLLKEAKERYNELHQKKSEIRNLYDQRHKIDQSQKELDRFEKTIQVFREPISNLTKLNTDKDVLSNRIEGYAEARKKIFEDIDQLNLKLEKVTLDFGQLDIFRQQKDDFNTLILIKKNQEKLKQEQANLRKGKPIVETSRQEHSDLLEQQKQNEYVLETLKNQRSNTTELLEIDAWYLTKDNIEEQIQTSQDQMNGLTTDIHKIVKEFQNENLDFEHWEQHIEHQIKGYNDRLTILAEEDSVLQVQLKLSEFAHNLTDGDPCPLCGALEHPHPMESQQTHQELSTNKEQANKIKDTILALQSLSFKFGKLSTQWESKQESLKNVNNIIAEKSVLLNDHLNKFKWSEFSPNDKSLFKQTKIKNIENEQKISQIESTLKKIRDQIQEKSSLLLKFENRIQIIQEQIAVATHLVEQGLTQLVVLSPSSYSEHTDNELAGLKQQMEIKISQTEQDYLQLTQALHQQHTTLADVSAKYQVSKDQFRDLRETLLSLRNQLSQLLEENQYQDLNEVKQIIEKNMPVDQLKQEIQQFHIQLQVLERQIENLQRQTDQDQYSEERFESVNALFLMTQANLENQLSKTGGLEKELAHLAVEYAKKEKLTEEFNLINDRAQDLKTLDNLFRGNGFVNYISTIHLDRLCEIANQRFRRLTKNQLSLTTSESNDFEVIDYLNNGHKRSVKTLSGGQLFQASLCLALALAENIQALNKANKNFFFIDEGFGTQDHESINTVFDTLQYLHQENRIVGIISHVDELKEKIPRALTVAKNIEKGSVIDKNY